MPRARNGSVELEHQTFGDDAPELRIIPGMGHDLPPGLHDIFVDAIATAASRAPIPA